MKESGENYLETILILKQRNGMVRSVDTVSYTHLDVYKRQLRHYHRVGVLAKLRRYGCRLQ